MALPSIDYLLYAPTQYTLQPQQQHKRRDSINSYDSGMDLTTLLNTNRSHAVVGQHRAMQYEIPVPVTSMGHEMNGAHYAQQTLYVPNGNSRIKSENGSERGVSPHTSEHSSRYSSQTPNNNAMAYLANQMQNGAVPRYPSPTIQQQGNMPLIQHSYHPNAVSDPYQQQTPMGAVQNPVVQDQSTPEGSRPSGSGLPKAFACGTCQKGFARRSDLARHERIHSGVRPHVCDTCGKQFIQRSALTVHSRVHTGEKPHMCERCGKPFSDSSSLARHRRIHSGKRPYKCPYADCQKTFTRRTTLTRHQNHHTGTIEESEAATAAALAARSMQTQRSRGSDDEDYSNDGKSPMPHQPDRNASVSPAVHVNGMPPQLQRQTSDYYMQAMSNGMAVPVPAHMRSEVQHSPRSQSPAAYQVAQMQNQQQTRPTLTSNPSSSYNPPQILEPPAANGQQQPGSASNSPHMSNQMGWQSPHSGMAQPTPDGYYADPNTQFGQFGNVSAAPLYYHQHRPHSTGPLDQQQMRGTEMWAQQQQ